MVVQEESGSDVEGDEHVNGVVFMCSQDEEDAEEIEDPGQSVNEVPASWSVLCDEEVEHSQNHSVATEHVVATRMHSSKGHPKTAPDGHSSL